MNPFTNVVTWLQDMLGQLPELLQPLIIAIAGAIPFVEGELASTLGVWAGLHPLVAFFAAATGNFACVVLVVLLSHRARTAIVARRASRVAVPSSETENVAVQSREAANDGVLDRGESPSTKPESKGRQRFRCFLVRFGVPGASILGPLALPTQFTSAMLVASGVRVGWVLLWQGVAIVLWTAFTTAVAAGVLALVLR